MTNPLLTPSLCRDSAWSFDLIKDEHFLPAIKEAIEISRRRIQDLKKDLSPPGFENTILVLEQSHQLLHRISGLYFSLFNAEATESLQSYAQEISILVAAYSNEILLDEALFLKVKKVFETRSQQILTKEQNQLIEDTYDHFVFNGALLSATQKEILSKLDQELAALSPLFSENVLKSTKAFTLILESKSDLEGLPTSIEEEALEVAKERGLEGKYVFTLDAHSFLPFLKYSRKRDLREKLWKAYAKRSFNGEYSNKDIVLKITKLRYERAQILGFKTHAEAILKKRMAENPQKVHAFLNQILSKAYPVALKEFNVIQELAKNEFQINSVMPWDVPFLSELIKKRDFDFNEEDLRSYFSLENVIQGIFEHGRRLFDLHFKAVDDIPKYHESVKVFNVTDSLGNWMGLLYLDLFPRNTKKPGAWMSPFREQGLVDAQMVRPHVSIVCNFTKPTSTKPSLLTYREVATLFHEFGHALHALLSQCTYPSISGTNVLWDFVELPSQIMENWIKEKESLSLFARHFQTREPLSDQWIDKIQKIEQFQSGLGTLRQLQYALLDMAWHDMDPRSIEDIELFESQLIKKTSLLPHIEGTTLSCDFSHIFSGGYSAGYYSYKWAEVLEADAFELFKEKGIFNFEISQHFKKTILEKGGTEHPLVLYKNFRGREPHIDGLLRRDGLLDETFQE